MDYEFLVRLLEPIFTKAPRLDATTAAIYIKESYLITFGLANDASLDARPLGLVAMYDAEDPTVCSRFDEHAKKFAELSIRETYGYSLKEFLREPRHKVEKIYAAAEAWQKTKAKDAGNMSAELQAQLAAAGIAPT